MTIITNARFPGSARRVDIAIKGGAIAAITPAPVSRRRQPAARRLGLTVRESGLVGELEWFDAYCKLDNAPGAAEETLELIRKAEADAARKGVVGIRDYEMAENVDTWTRRFSAASPRPRDANDSAWTGIDWDGSFTHGIRGLRVEAGVYPERLEDAIEAGWKTGVELPGSDGLGHVGAMKMISDGSLNTRSAFCSMPYSDIFPDFYGTLSYAPDQIETYFHVATCHGFAIACHAIGDEANTIVLNAAASTHAHGSIEHAQMLKPADIPRFAKLGLTASIQPQHAMDDRDVITRFWANPGGIPYAFKALHDAGVRLRMGSDAPVAPLDPWMAISAAVFGTESSDREPFQPEQCLDARTALAASTAVGRDRPEPGDPADLVLLDRDPYAVSTPEEMRAMPVAATMLAGRWTYSSLHDSRQGTHEDSSHESHREPSAAQARRQTSYRHDLSVITRAIAKPIGRQIITMNARNAQSSACSVSNCPR